MRSLIIVSVLGLLASGSLGQEVRNIDVSTISEPPTGELAHGSMIEAYSCIGRKEPNTQQAKLSLEWTETTDLYPRQRVRVEFRVENVGTTPLRLPIHPTLTDLLPKEPAKPFMYYRMELPLEALVPAEGSALKAGALDLYGALEQADTFITLKSGEWMRVKGNVSVQRWYKVDQTITMSTELVLSKYVFPAGKSKETTPSNEKCKLEWSTGGNPLNAYMHAEPQH